MGTGESFAAVVLAAGSGSRFGGAKLLADWRGAPLICGALAAARAAPVRQVVIVTGAGSEAVEAAARAFDPAIQVVHATRHAEGMAASLKAGIAAVAPQANGAFIFLGDMPRVPHEVLAPLSAAVRDGAPAAAPVFNGARGNPVVLSAALFPQVERLEGDVGARAILASLGKRLALLEAPDDGVLFDVDLRSDLRG